MEITRTVDDGHVELKLKGRLDAIWSDHVGRALTECVRQGHHDLALDMAEVDYISSAGIGVLVTCARQLKAIHGQLSVTGASDNVRKVLLLSGLGKFLMVQPSPLAAPAAPHTAPAELPPARIALSDTGTTAEVYDLDPTATLELDWPGDAAAWLRGQGAPDCCRAVEFPFQAMGLGLGVLGTDGASAGERLGEFLAAGGAAVCQPADGTFRPDYLVRQGSLTPTVQVAYGLVGRGGFRRLLRFATGPEQASVPLSVVLQACLEAVASDAAGVVMVAETASLVGAALQKTPCREPVGTAGGIFAFPGVRDWLSFTAEASLSNTTSLVVGAVAAGGRAASLPLLKPLVRCGELCGHFHAAAFPYRPLRKGRIDLAATVQGLFESERVLELLHLLNDWRPVSGAGESRFLRGACWCSPLEPGPSRPPQENAALKETIAWE
ncbi:MAG: STAS domain-containing protein [Thermoguttaceae bacterium]